MNENVKDTNIELKDEERTKCEIWTRVMGYHRPISSFNIGKVNLQNANTSTKRSAAAASNL